MASQPLKTMIGTLLIISGLVTFFGGLQLPGLYSLLCIPGLLLTCAVYYDQIFKDFWHYRRRKKNAK